MLTEAEVSKTWRQLFRSKDVSSETFDKAVLLIDELRDESPLRHRLTVELSELRSLYNVGEPA